MKKLVLLLSLLCFTTSSALAECRYMDMAPTKPYPVSGKGSQVIQKITGMNFISKAIAQSIIKKEIKKATHENFNVKMESFSAKDLLAGKFKSLEVSGKNLNIDGVYISQLSSKTLYDFNYVEVKKNEVTFKENMLMDMNMQITNNDLRKTVASTGYLDKLNKINLSCYGITFFKLSSADVQIKNNKIWFTINVTTPFNAKAIPIKVSTDVKISDGKIELTKMKLADTFKLIDLNKVSYLLNALNPLTFTTDVLNNKSKLSLDTIDIVNDTILIKGYVFIPKNTVEKG